MYKRTGRTESPSSFNLKPTHTDDPTDNLFSNPFTSNGSIFRAGSNDKLNTLSLRGDRSNSPSFGNTATLPSSAAPYIYSDHCPNSPSQQSQTSNVFYEACAPPVLKESGLKRNQNDFKQRATPPSAADTMKAAAAIGAKIPIPSKPTQRVSSMRSVSLTSKTSMNSSQKSLDKQSQNTANNNLQNSSMLSFSSSKSRSSSNGNLPYQVGSHDDHIVEEDHDFGNFDLTEDELNLPAAISAKITNDVTRTDPSGRAYTNYVIQVKTSSSETSVPMTVEHRYSEFAKLERNLAQYNIEINEPFPKRHWAGRLGNWTPSTTIAPRAHEDLIEYRIYQLNAWLVEVTSKYPQRAHQPLPLEFKSQLWEFLSNSTTDIPPCDRDNDIIRYGPPPFLDESDLMLENKNLSDSFQLSSSLTCLANPMSFTLGSAIRQAAYTVRTMCSSSSTLKIRDDASDQAIPLDLLHSARGLVFLTVVKGGFIVSFRGGTGLIIVRKRGTNLWSAPSALGTVGMGWGALIGGDITTYLIVLNTEEAVKAFTQPSGTVNLGAELGVAVGPLGRAGGGNLGTGTSGGVAPAYAYAHSKGLFAGISFEGSLVTCRPDVNSKFYGRPVSVKNILFGSTSKANQTPIHPPRAAQPLYDALFEAMNLSVPENGFRPSRILKS